ncbi:MAG: OmpA family protein [Schleiferiaceae bacterium]|nr:OmpA family protein [Schleiferiaceae bacterium]
MVVQSAELDFQNILFDFNSSEPRRISYVEINAMKDAFANLDSIALVLEGHTDDVGSDEYNYELGRLRAESVSAELRKSLRPTASLSTISLGESMAIAANDNDFHRSLNRRVSLVVKAAPKPAASSTVQEVPLEVDSTEEVMPEPFDLADDEPMVAESQSDSLEVIAGEVEDIPVEDIPVEDISEEDNSLEVQEVPSLFPSKAVQKENAKITKDLEREAKEKSRKDSIEKEKNAKAAKLEQIEKKKAAEAIEEARLRRTMDVAAQNKAEFEAKQALIKESEEKAKQQAKQQAKDAKAQAKEKKKSGK